MSINYTLIRLIVVPNGFKFNSNCFFLLAEVKSIKYLRFHYDNKLKWSIDTHFLTKVIRAFFIFSRILDCYGTTPN